MKRRRHDSPPYRTTAEELVPMAWVDPWTPTHRDVVKEWITIAHALGYRVSCYDDSRGEHWNADSGWPDLFLVRDGHALAVEVKVGRDTHTDEQLAWLTALNAIPGVTAVTFRPSDNRAHDRAVIADALRKPPPVLPRP